MFDGGRLAIFLAGLAATIAPVAPPTVDGVIGTKEWTGARREPLTGGGEALILRIGADLYVAVSGAKPGYPSLCVGDSRHVEVLHASAALGSVSYTKTNSQWLRGKPFEWRLRNVPELASAPLAERKSFLAEYRWLSTASRAGAPTREFRITLSPGRWLLGIVWGRNGNCGSSRHAGTSVSRLAPPLGTHTSSHTPALFAGLS